MRKRSALMGAINTVSFGFSGLLEYSNGGLQPLNHSSKLAAVVRKVGENIKNFDRSAADVLSTFGAIHFNLQGIALTS